jgi:hypothetical protein
LEIPKESEEADIEAPADKDHTDEEKEQDVNEDELEIVQVIPQKRKNGKDTKKSRLVSYLFLFYIF